MEQIIDHEALASYLVGWQDLTEDQTSKVVELTNRRIVEVIGEDVDEIPAEVESFALEVAARALSPNLVSSVTTTQGDTSKTKRREGTKTTARRPGVYVTETEKRLLLAMVGKGTRPRRPRSIRTYVP